MYRTTIIVATLALSAAPLAHGQLIKFEELTDTSSIVDMSPDGRYLVGGNAFGGGSYLMDRWTNTFTVLPPEGSASAVSDDGTVVVGQMDNPDGVSQPVAGRWTAATGWESLGTLPGAMGTCGGLSNAYEISADGTVVVGLSAKDGCAFRGFRWTQATGMIELADVSGNGSCRASVVSGDGSLIGGFCQGSFSRTPVIWQSDGSGILLDPPNGDQTGEVAGMSDDGSVILGEWGGNPFLIDEVSGFLEFSSVVSSWTGTAQDIADDGTIVGYDRSGGNRLAWIKPDGGPAVGLLNYLNGLGVPDVAPSLDVAQVVSQDGRIVAGSTVFSFGWIVNLCVPDIDGSGAVDFGDLLMVLSDWDNTVSPADLDGSGTVGFGDLLIVLSGWGPCP